jgi:hypothetical protein
MTRLCVQHGSTATGANADGLAGTREDGDLRVWTAAGVVPVVCKAGSLPALSMLNDKRPAQKLLFNPVGSALGTFTAGVISQIPPNGSRRSSMSDDHPELRPWSRPRARYQSRAGVPRSLARPFAAASPIASVIMPARVRLSTATRAAAASMTSIITRCRRLASRASCRMSPDMEAGAANPMLMVMSSRSPWDHPVRCGQISVLAERRRSRSFGQSAAHKPVPQRVPPVVVLAYPLVPWTTCPWCADSWSAWSSSAHRLSKTTFLMLPVNAKGALSA